LCCNEEIISISISSSISLHYVALSSRVTSIYNTQAGRLSEAETMLSEAVKLQPSNSMAQNMLGMVRKKL
jgi:Flp pilus assembly protein TadD